MPWARKAGATCASRTEPWPSTWPGSFTCSWRTRSIGSASALDGAGLQFARTRGHTPALERGVGAFSRTGEHAACWLALGLGGTALSGEADRRRRWLRGVRVVAGAYAANYAVKLAAHRRRPELAGLPALTPTVSALSFPSAHATTS